MFEELNKDMFINRLKAGDEHALDYAMKRMSTRLTTFLIRDYNLSHEDAEDIVIESWAKIHRNIGRFTLQGAKLTTWVFEVVKNTAIDHLRKQARIGHESSLSLTDLHGFSSIKDSAVIRHPINLDFEPEVVQDQPLILQLRQALNSLSKPARAVLLMRQSMTTEEIAEAENISEAGVRMRYKRAVKALRTALEKVIADER